MRVVVPLATLAVIAFVAILGYRAFRTTPTDEVESRRKLNRLKRQHLLMARIIDQQLKDDLIRPLLPVDMQEDMSAIVKDVFE